MGTYAPETSYTHHFLKLELQTCTSIRFDHHSHNR